MPDDADDDPFIIECATCGGLYHAEREKAEDHDEDCAVFDTLVNRGEVRDPRTLEEHR